ALAESESLYRTLAEAAQDFITLINRDMIIEYTNSFAAHLFKSLPEKMIGKRITDIFPTESANRQEANLQMVFDSGESLYIEATTGVRNTTLWLGSWLMPVKGTDGKVNSVLVVSRDITDRMLAENKLRESEERFRHAFDYASAGICIIGLDGKFQRINNSFKEMMGYTEDEIKHFTIAEITHPDDVSITVSNIKKMLAGEITHASFEKRYIRKDKKTIWAYVSTSMVLNAAHQSNFIITQIIEITERKLAEEELERSSAYVSAIIENQPGLLWLKDTEGRFLSVNTAFAVACGKKTPTDVVGKIDRDIWPRELAEKYITDDALVIKNARSISVEELIQEKGEAKWFETFKTPVKNASGKIIGTTGFSRDITERKLAEEALKQSQERYREVVENASEIIYTTDNHGNFIYCNPAGLQHTGYSLDAANRVNYLDILLPEDRSRIKHLVFKQFLQKTPSIYFESRYVKKSGVVAWMGQNSTLLFEKGEVIGFQMIARDITERKLSDEIILAERNFSTAALDSMPGLFYMVDKYGKFLRWNNNLETVSGYSPDEILHMGPLDFFEGSEKSLIAEKIRQTSLSTAAVVEADFVSKNKTKTRYSFSWKKFIVDGKPTFIGMGIDITGRQKAEEAQRLSEEKFSRMFDLSPDAMNLCSMPDGKYITVNQSFLDLSGYTLDEVIGKSSLELDFWINVDQRTEFGAMLDKTKGYATLETKLKMKGGKIIDALMSGKLIEVNGMPHLLIITRDITKRKQEEKEISMLAQTIKGITECVSITDVNDNVLFVNRAFEDTYGYSADELVGKQIEVVRSPKTRAEVGREILPATLVGGWKGELWNKRKDGTEFPVLLSTSTVKDQRGNVTALVGIAEDISRQKLAEQELNILNSALQSAANAIVITDRQGIIIAVNPAFSKVTGYASEEVIGKKLSILKSGKQSPEFYKNLWEKILAGNVWKGEIINKRKDGKEYIEKMTITPVRNSTGEITQFIAIKEDVTEQKNLQAQFTHIQKMESIGTLASGIAHDFNNILGIILAYVYVLGKGKLDDKKYKESIQTIQDAVNRGAGLVKQILTFARKTDTSFAQMNIPDLVREIVTMLHETFSKIVDIRVDIGLNIPIVKADHTQIHQALLNLCVNARDAMPKGGQITIAVESVSRDVLVPHFPNVDQERYVCISVSDTGTGMDEATQARIFDPFFTTKEKGKGTGLGLAVVFGVMQSHNGFVRVSSTMGIGTTFYLYLPVQTAVEKFKKIKEEEKTTSVGGNETILLVEDEDSLRDIV
ncbi:MAG: PAS domain S-box protein, partial [Bacteroidota bacterium]|nr:PAS domain S-box protein [Bacteroidota bacterium]